MARGQPDYNNPDYEIAVQQDDNSIMAVLESGFAFLDNRGRIVWSDNFKQGLMRWFLQAANGGSNPAHIYTEALSYGHYGAVMLDSVVNTGESIMFAEGILPFAGRAGVEIMCNPAANHAKFKLYLSVNTGDNSGFAASLNIVEGTHAITITTASATETIYTPPAGAVLQGKWVNIKLVADFEIGKYYRLVVGGHQFDLSAYTLAAITTQLKGRFYVQADTTGKAGVNVEPVYIGGVSLTADEP